MTELTTLLDPETCPEGDMFTELLWYETQCSIKRKLETTEAEVREWLRARGRPDLAEAFSTRYLLS